MGIVSLLPIHLRVGHRCYVTGEAGMVREGGEREGREEEGIREEGVEGIL